MMMKLHRIAHWCWRHRVPLVPKLLKVINRIAFGVVLPPQTQVGAGVLIGYQGLGTVIHRETVLEDGVVLASGVTLGGRSGRQGAPTIGRQAMIGTGAKILGPVRVGAYASIGANAVVLEDIPDFAVAVGVPARVVRINKPSDLPDYQEFRQ
jgi:serine O-acetyltransferase